MTHSKFGGSYPAGCSGPPDDDCPDPHPKSEEMYSLLEAAGCSQDVIDAACKIVDELAAEAAADCPVCLERYVQAEREAMDKANEYEMWGPAGRPDVARVV